MKQKKFSTKRQRSKFEEDCYDASSLEETYELDAEGPDDLDEDDEKDDIDDVDDIKDIAHITTSSVVEDANKPKKRGPKPNKTQFYVEPVEFDAAIMEFYKTGVISDNLASMINKIAQKLSYAANFINYTYKDEMVGDAIVRMIKALIAKKYAHAKGRNPFSYFTKIAFNAFRNRIKREKYAHETLQKYQEEVIMTSEYVNFMKNKKSMYATEDIASTEEC